VICCRSHMLCMLALIYCPVVSCNHTVEHWRAANITLAACSLCFYGEMLNFFVAFQKIMSILRGVKIYSYLSNSICCASSRYLKRGDLHSYFLNVDISSFQFMVLTARWMAGFRRVRNTAKSDYYLRYTCQSVCLSPSVRNWTTRLPLNEFW